MILISSPEDSDNWFSRLLSLKNENGKNILFSFKFVSVCEECRKKPPQEMKKSKMAKNAIPPHKEKKKTLKYGKAYESEGLQDQNLRENYGEITKSTNCSFPSHLIDNVFGPEGVVKLVHNDLIYNIKRITCAIDPNGGGKNRTAIWFGYYNLRTGNNVVSFSFFSFFRHLHSLCGQNLEYSNLKN